MLPDGEVLQDMLRTQTVYTAAGEACPLHGALGREAAGALQRLVYELRPNQTLEVGMAYGGSTLAILYALDRLGNGDHVAIDPNQSRPNIDEVGWGGIGRAMVDRAGLSHRLKLIERPSYLALPDLVDQGYRFQLILIDGWHSFDYAFVDYFYADLLLDDGGVLVFDDVGLPQVNHVTYFLETHKAYTRIGGGPAWEHPMSPLVRLRHRLRGHAPGFDSTWGSLRAYRKERSSTVPWFFFHAPFYPYYSLYRWWGRLRGHARVSPIGRVISEDMVTNTPRGA
jgi:predicted O-methyltransferase YrrM